MRMNTLASVADGAGFQDAHAPRARLRNARLGANAAWLVLVLLVAACSGQSGAPTVDPAATTCDGIGADFGGCSPDRPVYSGTSCPELAAEWGRDVDRRIVGLVNGPSMADGKARSVRNTDALVLTSLVVTYRLDALGLRASCNMDEFWPIAQRQFSADTRAGAGSVLWDAAPVVPFDDWLARAKEIVGMIDSAVPGSSVPALPRPPTGRRSDPPVA
jgi:hypothetical protein